MGLKTSGETMQTLNNSSRRCVHVNAIFSPPGCALPKWGVGREAIVFTTCYVMQQGAKAGQTVGIRTYRICQRVLMFHHFPDELDVHPSLVRSTHFTYAFEQQPGDALNPIYTFLVAVKQVGYRKNS